MVVVLSFVFCEVCAAKRRLLHKRWEMVLRSRLTEQESPGKQQVN